MNKPFYITIIGLLLLTFSPFLLFLNGLTKTTFIIHDLGLYFLGLGIGGLTFNNAS